jgi:5'-methylthioadenosine phosphorylase
MIAVIGGSGLTQLANLQITRRQIVRTPYGEPSGPLTFGRIGDQEAVFLARHGYGHTLAPHEVNYRANLWAIHAQKVTRVVAIATVGGISANLGAGTIAVPDQIIDYTWGRPSTYFEGAEQPVTHIDFTYPYNEELRKLAIASAKEAGVAVVDGGTYAAVQGPRLETKAEIDRLERDGATMVGMTGMPEAGARARTWPRIRASMCGGEPGRRPRRQRAHRVHGGHRARHRGDHGKGAFDRGNDGGKTWPFVTC